MPMKVPSISGLSEPAAKGAIVMGMSAAERSLPGCKACQQAIPKCPLSLFSHACLPLERPVIAAMARLWVRNCRCVVHGASDGLRKRGEDGALGGGLEGCSLLQSQERPLGEFGRCERGDGGGGEGALGGRSQRLAEEEGGAESGSHGEGAVSDRWQSCGVVWRVL